MVKKRRRLEGLQDETEGMAGYKQTEVGMIPDDWEVKKLGYCLIRNPEYGINASAVPYSDNLPVYIRITDISKDGSFLPENKVSVNHTQSAKYILENDDLVLARTGASTGKSYLYNPQDGYLVFAGFLIRVKVNPQKLDAQYLKGFLNTKAYWNWVIVMSMRSGQPGINGNEYAQLPIPLPPTLEEQKAIALCLSDTDALISACDRATAKKRNIKQGAMQQLLTGKKRLPGFSGEWQHMPLGLLSAFITKGATPTTYGFKWEKEGVLFLRSECVGEYGIDLAQSMFIAPEAHNVLKRGEVRAGDILITITGNVGRVVHLDKSFGIANINQHIARIRVTDINVVAEYVFHFLSQSSVRHYYSLITTGQAYPQISLKQVRETTVPLPPLLEQKAIAQILSDMDAEIAALEKKRDKYKAMKQGMMQELLTGKTRLVDR